MKRAVEEAYRVRAREVLSGRTPCPGSREPRAIPPLAALHASSPESGSPLPVGVSVVMWLRRDTLNKPAALLCVAALTDSLAGFNFALTARQYVVSLAYK